MPEIPREVLPILLLAGCASMKGPHVDPGVARPESRDEAIFMRELGEIHPRVDQVVSDMLTRMGVNVGYVEGESGSGAEVKSMSVPYYYPQDFHFEDRDCYGQIGIPVSSMVTLDPSPFVTCVTHVPLHLMSDPVYATLRGRTDRDVQSAHVPQLVTRLYTRTPEGPTRTLDSEKPSEKEPMPYVMFLEGETPESPLCQGGRTEYRFWSTNWIQYDGKPGEYARGHASLDMTMEETIHTCPPLEGSTNPRVYTTYVFQKDEGIYDGETSTVVEDVLLRSVASETFPGGYGYDHRFALDRSTANLEGHAVRSVGGDHRPDVYEPRRVQHIDVAGPQLETAVEETFEATWMRLQELKDAWEAVNRSER